MPLESGIDKQAARADFFACETCMKDMHLTRFLVRSAADEGRTGQEGGVLAKAGRMRRGERVNIRVQSSDGVVATTGMCLASCLLGGSMHESRRERRRRRLSSAL